MSKMILSSEEKRVLRNAVRRSKLTVGDHVYTMKGCRMSGASEGYIVGFAMYGNAFGNWPGVIVRKDRRYLPVGAHKTSVYRLDNLVKGWLR